MQAANNAMAMQRAQYKEIWNWSRQDCAANGCTPTAAVQGRLEENTGNGETDLNEARNPHHMTRKRPEINERKTSTPQDSTEQHKYHTRDERICEQTTVMTRQAETTSDARPSKERPRARNKKVWGATQIENPTRRLDVNPSTSNREGSAPLSDQTKEDAPQYRAGKGLGGKRPTRQTFHQ